MKIGSTYNAYDVIRELEPFLNELRVSGYRVEDFRRRPWRFGALVIVHLGHDAIGVYLTPRGHIVGSLSKMWGGSDQYFSSTEELEILITHRIKRYESCKEMYHEFR